METETGEAVKQAVEARGAPAAAPRGATAAVPPPGAGPLPVVGQGRRGGQVRFVLAIVLLCGILALEVASNAFHLLFFLLRRRSQRERVRRIMFHGTGAGGALLSVLLALLLAGSGCAPRERTEGMQGMGGPGSFQRQVRELGWSARALADQSDSRRSLVQDLESLLIERNWKQNLLFDARNLFLMADARRSLESDLEALGDPDHRRHGLLETLRMWGW